MPYTQNQSFTNLKRITSDYTKQNLSYFLLYLALFIKEFFYNEYATPFQSKNT